MTLNYLEIEVLQDAYKSLHNNEFLSDIKFKFPGGGIIFAHSFVLCCRSDEFRRSFQNTFGVAKLVDVEIATYDEYLQFLKYLYTDSCEINKSNVKNLIRLSKKHKLLKLEAKCYEIIEQEIKINNACTILENSFEIESNILKEKSTDFIARNYLACLTTESFLHVNKATLSEILNMESVSHNDEFKIFESVMEWAKVDCFSNGIDPTSAMKRNQLGELFKLIRFGAMTANEFTKCHEMEPGLFTTEEIISIFLNISTGETNKFGFIDKKRNNYLDCVKFSDLLWTKSENVSGDSDYIRVDFSVSQQIKLEHIKLYRIMDVEKIGLVTRADKQLIYFKTKPFNGVVNVARILEANTIYRIYLYYSIIFHRAYTETENQIKSESGNVVFTMYDMESIIQEFIFSSK